MNSDIFTYFSFFYFNLYAHIGDISQEFKHAGITHVYKKKEESNRNNHRLFSILPSLSKVYEKEICKQLHNYFDKTLYQTNVDFAKDIVLSIACWQF